MQQTIAGQMSHRRSGSPARAASSPRRPSAPVAPAPVRRPLPCRIEDPDLWSAESPDQLEAAKRLCGGCPLRDTCLAGALDRAEPWGVWGGEILERGVVIERKRPRGRPREVVAARGPATDRRLALIPDEGIAMVLLDHDLVGSHLGQLRAGAEVSSRP